MSITLATVDGTDPILALKALKLSSRDMYFDKVLLISYEEPYEMSRDIEFAYVSKLTWVQYNDFIVHKLNEYITTDHCLLIQTDGFVLNAQLWDTSFLQYDYIGAPWEDWHKESPLLTQEAKNDYNYVGNGGFSLRSKKLLEVSASCPAICDNAEDVYICNNNKKYFLERGIKYAPVDVARRFSQDPLPDMISTFGFHGDKSIIHRFNI